MSSMPSWPIEATSVWIYLFFSRLFLWLFAFIEREESDRVETGEQEGRVDLFLKRAASAHCNKLNSLEVSPTRCSLHTVCIKILLQYSLQGVLKLTPRNISKVQGVLAFQRACRYFCRLNLANQAISLRSFSENRKILEYWRKSHRTIWGPTGDHMYQILRPSIQQLLRYFSLNQSN